MRSLFRIQRRNANLVGAQAQQQHSISQTFSPHFELKPTAPSRHKPLKSTMGRKNSAKQQDQTKPVPEKKATPAPAATPKQQQPPQSTAKETSTTGGKGSNRKGGKK